MVTIDPWAQRPKQPSGDPNPHAIFCSVGMALTAWETIEGEISTAYVGLIDATDYRSNKYFKTPSFESRYGLISSAITSNINNKDCSGFQAFVDLVLKYGARRHEIAHGRVFNLGEHGFYLGPNNVLVNRHYPAGVAKYQYTAADIQHYASEFLKLAEKAKEFSERLAAR